MPHELFRCKEKNEDGLYEQRLIVVGTSEYRRVVNSPNWEKVAEKEAENVSASLRDTSATSGQTRQDSGPTASKR